jgi:23S rRNA pseudouridine1911/1915/1917 synthase
MCRQSVKSTFPDFFQSGGPDHHVVSYATLKPGAYRFVVPAEQSGLRLDHFLAAGLDGAARGLVKRLIEVGGVHVDGRRVRRCSLPLLADQRIELYVDGLSLVPFRLEPGQVLYRDRYLLALDKPAGIATQPTPARYQGTLFAALPQLLGRAGAVSVGMVQRLDRDTSGVIIFSTHPRAHKGLTAAFSEHRVRKRYLALVAGVPGEVTGEIRSLLARRRSTNRTVSVERGGKLAVTRYRVVERFAAAALLEVEILTGRTHQIRVHLAEAGHPLLGDAAYGGASDYRGMAIPRQMLHASELQLDHPVSGEGLTVRAPLPLDFAAVRQALATVAAR